MMACAAATAAAAGCSSGPSGPGGSTGSAPATQALDLAAQTAHQLTSFGFSLHESISGTVNETVTDTGTIRLKPSPLADMSMSIGLGGQSVQLREILTGDSVYLYLPALSAEVGKPWIHVSAAELRKTSGIDVSQLANQMDAEGPASLTVILKSARNVRQAGTQVIDGVQTTRYTGTYSAASLGGLPPSLQKLITPAMKVMGITTVHFTVWIDGQHRLRKIVDHDSGDPTQADLTLDVTGMNEPVTVQLPPPDQVASPPDGIPGL